MSKPNGSLGEDAQILAAVSPAFNEHCQRGHKYDVRMEYGRRRKFCRECHNNNRKIKGALRQIGAVLK